MVARLRYNRPDMSVIISLFLIFLAAMAVVVAAMRPPRSHVGSFELNRRASEGDSAAALSIRREKTRDDIVSVQRVLLAVLLIIFILVATLAYEVWMGLTLAVLLAVFHGSVGRLKLVRRYADKMYHEREPDLLNLAERYGRFIWWIRFRPGDRVSGGVHSREELAHLVEDAKTLGGEEQKRLILNALWFHDRRVGEAMTPRSELKSVKKTEILGPLVLDDLHKSGHQSFPVTNGDIDQIVGILRLSDVTTLDTARKHTSLAETAMRPHVHYIAQDRPLQEALGMLLGNQEHVLIVVDESSHVVGILTLSDIMRTLFGK